MAPEVGQMGQRLAVLSFGTLMYFVYWGQSIVSGLYFHRESEKERLELAIARDRTWNLSKPFKNMAHQFYVLRNGQQLHYVTNDPHQSPGFRNKPLVILLHGYPDSFALWSFIFDSPVLQGDAVVVAVDLPGFGGSDSLPPYSATVVLEALAEFVLGMRELYDVDTDADSGHGHSNGGGGGARKVYLCAHDWGAAVGFRLAADAPALADRFILTNGPHPRVLLANRDRGTKFAAKMLMAFLKAPVRSRHCLPKALKSLWPLVRQSWLFSYIAVFQLPEFMVRYLLAGGNRSFLRGAHKLVAHRSNSQYNEAAFLANSLGPSPVETNSQTQARQGGKPRGYSASVVLRAVQKNSAYEATSYYRSGVGYDRWEKSLETIAGLHEIELADGQLGPRRYSSGALLFNEPYEGTLRSPVTVVWGQRDPMLSQKVCLDGIGDYLGKGSQVIMLPRSGHWTPIETEGRHALQKVLEWAVRGERLDQLEADVQGVYAGAYVSVKK